MRFANTKRRPVPGGFVQRYHLGDRYGWQCFDADGERISTIGARVRTLEQAKAHVLIHKLTKEARAAGRG